MKKMIFKPRIYYFAPLLVWFLLLILPFISSPPNVPELERLRFLQHIFVNNLLLLIIFYAHTYLLYPLSRRGRLLWYTTGMVVLTFLYISCTYFFRFVPLNGPDMAFPHPRSIFMGGGSNFGSASPMGPSNFMPVLSLLITLLCSFCYRVIIDNAERERLLKERETAHLRTELNFLRSQINPHFLFNILNNITSLARKKSDRLEPAIVSLSQLMRYMLYETTEHQVPLAKEIAYLKNYINLQLLRFNNEVVVKTEFTGDHETNYIDPMLLIPLVENAFKYGTDGAGENHITITLTVPGDNSRIHFKIVNFCNPEDRSISRDSGIGLKNIKRRLDIVYPGAYEFKIFATQNTFTAELNINLATIK